MGLIFIVCLRAAWLLR